MTNPASRYRYSHPSHPTPTILPSRSNVALTIMAAAEASQKIFATSSRPLLLTGGDDQQLPQEMTIHSKTHK